MLDFHAAFEVGFTVASGNGVHALCYKLLLHHGQFLHLFNKKSQKNVINILVAKTLALKTSTVREQCTKNNIYVTNFSFFFFWHLTLSLYPVKYSYLPNNYKVTSRSNVSKNSQPIQSYSISMVRAVEFHIRHVKVLPPNKHPQRIFLIFCKTL